MVCLYVDYGLSVLGEAAVCVGSVLVCLFEAYDDSRGG